MYLSAHVFNFSEELIQVPLNLLHLGHFIILDLFTAASLNDLVELLWRKWRRSKERSNVLATCYRCLIFESKCTSTTVRYYRLAVTFLYIVLYPWLSISSSWSRLLGSSWSYKSRRCLSHDRLAIQSSLGLWCLHSAP